MRARIYIAVAAWLLGAATATGGCLLAVSLLGDGFGAGNSGQQLTATGVNRALAAAERHSSSAPAATPSRSARARPVTRHPRKVRPSPTPTPSSTPTPAQSTTPAGTPLSSQGGTVVATCESAGAYLISWIPAQGYEVSHVFRGPAPVASVSFETNTTEVDMHISCQGGTPVANTSRGH